MHGDDTHIVARALCAHTGIHEKAQTFVVARSLDTNAGDYSRTDSQAIVAHTLRAAGHDASEDGTGRGTPIVVADTPEQVLFRRRVTQLLSDAVAPSVVSNGDAHSGFRDAQGLALGFNATQDPISTPDGMHALSDQGAAVLAFDTTQITSPTNRCRPEPGDPCHPLAAGAHPPAIAFQERGRPGEGRVLDVGGDVAYALTAPKTGGRGQERNILAAVPRRLTPCECERLQGFPDDWTAWGLTEDGERVELSDSPRYAMMGNAVSVPVIEWIGRRLARAVVAALRGDG